MQTPQLGDHVDIRAKDHADTSEHDTSGEFAYLTTTMRQPPRIQWYMYCHL